MSIVERLLNSGLYKHIANQRISKRNIKFVRSNTKTKITEEQKKQVLEYYKPYAKVNTAFHDYYAEKTGTFDVRYIPDDLYFCQIDKFYNNWHDAKVVENKCYYKQMFPNARQPETFCYRINGFWYTGEMERVSYEELLERVASLDEVVIKKATATSGGRGVSFANRMSEGGIVKAFDEAVFPIQGDIVVQMPIKQHAVLNSICSSSVNSIRMLSLLRQEGVKICSISLRMGIGNSRVDNVSSGGFSCGMDMEGRLKAVGHTKKGESLWKHPTSGVEFSTITIPGIDKAIDMVKEMHPRIPHFRLVSWDLSIGEDGEPILIEANLSYGGIQVHQLNNGPVFGDDTEQVLQEVFGKKA